jgi:hypothetical protein
MSRVRELLERGPVAPSIDLDGLPRVRALLRALVEEQPR